MKNTCPMNCHSCNFQNSIETKSTCATLLMPAMFAQLIGEIQELKNILNKNNSIEVTEIKLPLKINENDKYNESNNSVAIGDNESENGDGVSSINYN